MSQRKNLCTLQLAGLSATKFEEELRLHDGLSLLSSQCCLFGVRKIMDFCTPFLPKR